MKVALFLRAVTFQVDGPDRLMCQTLPVRGSSGRFLVSVKAVFIKDFIE